MTSRAAKGRALRLVTVERTVSSLDRLVPFYQHALGFELRSANVKADVAWTNLLGAGFLKVAQMQLGSQTICLTEFAQSGRPYPREARACDLIFQHIAIVVSDIHKAYDRLRDYGALPITHGGPVQLPPNTGNVAAYKFRDPDGHPLEFIYFPPGVGHRAWEHKRDLALLLGYDHTAISVANVETSLQFYCEILGMSVVGATTNTGVMQQTLDGLSGAIVDVLALEFAGAHLPHLELLAYRQPSGYALDRLMSASDVAGDRIVIQVDDLGVILERLPEGTYQYETTAAGQRLALTRDPDGHLILLAQ